MSRSPLSSLNPVENRRSRPFSTPCSVTKTDDGTGKKYHSREDREQERKEVGLGWMVKPVPKPERKSTLSKEWQPVEPRVQEKEAQIISVRQDNNDYFGRLGTDRSCTSYGEYEFDDGPSRKKFLRTGVLNENNKLSKTNGIAKRMLTQQERCGFCFQNPSRPLHLVISVANFTYLVLPKQPVVPGHCYILPVQHESSMRTVDKNVWEEIRNFKKCLIMMFAKQEKGVVFLETVMGLAQQCRHCLVECIPLPQDVARQAPLYFKKAIDEAEDEWSQHDAKKLIDTSQKGLCGSIPKDFPYFYVEFGLDRGFVHVIEDETQFKSNFGLNVIRGMLRLPQEDMYRCQKYESAEAQKHAVAAFARQWEPLDWTKQL